MNVVRGPRNGFATLLVCVMVLVLASASLLALARQSVAHSRQTRQAYQVRQMKAAMDAARRANLRIGDALAMPIDTASTIRVQRSKDGYRMVRLAGDEIIQQMDVRQAPNE